MPVARRVPVATKSLGNGWRLQEAGQSSQLSGSYRNNFGEAGKGLEGVLINFVLKPLVSKLGPELPRLQAPENMVSGQPISEKLLWILEIDNRNTHACKFPVSDRADYHS